MALLPENLSFSRKILPVIAVIGLIFAVVFIARGTPDRQLDDPEREPPRATGELANSARVAGAGLVYLSGGNPLYLTETLRDSAVWHAIVEAWGRRLWPGP